LYSVAAFSSSGLGAAGAAVDIAGADEELSELVDVSDEQPDRISPSATTGTDHA
jgi:hypothetical protein